MKKMTDNEIIKALECCGRDDVLCCDCAYFDKHFDLACSDALYIDALDLINRQKAEIERLEQIIKDSHSICEDCKEKYAEEFEDAKAEARKEFWEKLKEKRYGGTYPYVLITEGDNLLKEMESD